MLFFLRRLVSTQLDLWLSALWNRKIAIVLFLHISLFPLLFSSLSIRSSPSFYLPYFPKSSLSIFPSLLSSPLSPYFSHSPPLNSRTTELESVASW